MITAAFCIFVYLYVGILVALKVDRDVPSHFETKANWVIFPVVWLPAVLWAIGDVYITKLRGRK